MSAIVERYREGRAFQFTGLAAQTAEFKALPQEERATFDFVFGHVHFGIHRWLPEPATCATMLRDPVDRIIAHYCFIRRTPQHYLHNEIRLAGCTLQQYALQPPNMETDNDQVRWLAEVEHDEVPPGQVSRALLEQARWNLQHGVTALGIMERYEETIECLRAAFGWSDFAVCSDGRRPGRPQISMPRRSLQAMRHTNRWDMELYEFARELFERQLIRLHVAARAGGEHGNEQGALAGPQDVPAGRTMAAGRSGS